MKILNWRRQRRLAVILVCTISLSMAGVNSTAAVYKTTDAEGNVEFTDVPPNRGSSAESTESTESTESIESTVELPASNVYTPDVPARAVVPTREEPAEAPAFNYQSVAIVSPENDSAVRENAGNVTIVTQVEPGLQEGHSIQVVLDGQPWPDTARGSLRLTNIDRGTHTISAQIVDESNQVLLTSAPVTFHLLRISVLTRPAN